MSASVEPSVTVAMPACNAAAYIAQATESVLAQTFADFELLLVDDGSTDDTLAIMHEYDVDKRVRIVALAHNHGRPFVRNQCLAQARGEYIALLDADDACAPERLARQHAWLEAHPEIAVLGSRSKRIDAAGQAMPDDASREPLTPDAVRCAMLFLCPIHNPTVMARTQALRGFRYDPDFAHAEDYELWARMSATHRMANLPDKLTTYRRHAAQATTADQLAVDADWRRIHTRQLEALGVAFAETDLQYHALLHRGRRHFRQRTGRAMDRDFIRWARPWLEALLKANAQCGLYPEPAFTCTVGRLWWALCRKATRHAGSAVWLEFARSPLKTAVLCAGGEGLFGRGLRKSGFRNRAH